MKNFPWIFSSIWLFILAFMIWAGVWQLGRAEEKKTINQRLSDQSILMPQTSKQWQQLKAFNQVRVSGQYLDTHLLLDNQIMDGQVGHFIFTAFETINQQIILINRGWTDNSKQNFDVGNKSKEIIALAADWPRPGFQLGEQDVQTSKQQHVTYMPQNKVQRMLKERHCQQNKAEDCIILPLVLKLDGAMSDGFTRNWQLPRMTVEKHQAYAAQWFTMSLVLCLVYGIFLRKFYFKKTDQ